MLPSLFLGVVEPCSVPIKALVSFDAVLDGSGRGLFIAPFVDSVDSFVSLDFLILKKKPSVKKERRNMSMLGSEIEA